MYCVNLKKNENKNVEKMWTLDIHTFKIYVLIPLCSPWIIIIKTHASNYLDWTMQYNVRIINVIVVNIFIKILEYCHCVFFYL